LCCCCSVHIPEQRSMCWSTTADRQQNHMHAQAVKCAVRQPAMPTPPTCTRS
jgi:hypothetical protein